MANEQSPTPIRLSEYLGTLLPSDRAQLCTSVLPILVRSISQIAKALQLAQQVSLVGAVNAFGDDQLNVDLSAENIIRAALAASPSVSTASSEEEPIERPACTDSPTRAVGSEQYTVAFDPLDGSSIIAPNWSVGTIIGIWDGPSALGQPPSEKMVASVLGIYGPRTTIVIALRVPGSKPICFEAGLGTGADSEDPEVLLVQREVRFADPPFKTRYFAPANLRAAAENDQYMALVTHYVKQKYTLRYSGGLVPDIVHALVKKQGVYISPVTGKSKAKLRKLYELYPVALIIECAGGSAVNPEDGSDILTTPIGHCDERAGFVCGTTEEVQFAIKSLLNKPDLE